MLRRRGELTFSMPKYRSPGDSLYHSRLVASPVAAPPVLLAVAAGPELLPHFRKKLMAPESSLLAPAPTVASCSTGGGRSR